ncbi:MAG: gamma-glutamyl-gamma-aminobutyrate hydrolase family protein [Anaerovoracaceae bacterium]|nr:gamma-glutamyl-gamma-aminobutyrate hydrolase family protein [Bacillota bacterium]MDY2670002.1 gamma-glutamyl-gamma-aminobutyrate hydrolase family protein [Anaerovoracaceae bacterium]
MGNKTSGKKRPVIGVMPLWDDYKDSIWMLPGYFDGLTQAGAVPVMLPLRIDEAGFYQIAGMFDGFLFTGGHDVSPLLYGEEITPACGIVNIYRDSLETTAFDYCMEHDVPALAICRGIQIMNVCLGGTLYQDLPSQRPESRTDHHMQRPYDRVQHKVSIEDGTPLRDLLGVSELGVNSYHHQAVKDPGKDAQVMAVSEDSLVEALRVPDRSFIWAVQWHPEFSFKSDENSRRIFKAFVDAAARRS